MNTTLKWGILGNAAIARNYLLPALLAAPNCEAVALASRGKVQTAQFPNLRLYESYEALLDDPEIDAIYVPVPNALHSMWSIKAMKKGKHVLCEKPMGLSYAQCLEMFKVARENDVLLMEAFMYRFSPKTNILLEQIRRGVLGKIKGAHINFGYMLDWVSPARQDPNLGGGCLYDIGCYCIDLCNIIARQCNASLLDTNATYKMCKGIDERASVWLRYTGDLLLTFNVWFDAQAYQELILIGEKGVMQVPEVFRGTPDGMFLHTTEGVSKISTSSCNSYMLEVQAFSDAVLSGGQPLVSMEDTLQNLKIIDTLLVQRPV